MAQEPKVATTDMTPMDGARLMASYDFGMVPIVDPDRRLVGVVTDRDIVIRVLASGLDPQTVELGEIATNKNLVTIGPDDTVAEARERMATNRIKRLPVVKSGELVGVIALGDVAVTSASPREVGEAVAELSRSPATEQIEGTAEPATGAPPRVGRPPEEHAASSDGGASTQDSAQEGS
jgi:signal-transduction protein with cAMP-binding, CBS, and nucleotidyltransferase domain